MRRCDYATWLKKVEHSTAALAGCGTDAPTGLQGPNRTLCYLVLDFHSFGFELRTSIQPPLLSSQLPPDHSTRNCAFGVTKLRSLWVPSQCSFVKYSCPSSSRYPHSCSASNSRSASNSNCRSAINTSHEG